MDEKLAAARDRLAGSLFALPQVRLIDVAQERGTHSLFLRVHLVPGADPKSLGIPDEIDGFCVRVLFADYRLD